MGPDDSCNGFRQSCELAFAFRDEIPSTPWRSPQSGTRGPHPYPVTRLTENGRAIAIATPSSLHSQDRLPREREFSEACLAPASSRGAPSNPPMEGKHRWA